MAWYNDVWDFITGQSAKTYSNLAKTGVAALSTYASYKDQKAKNELQQAAYDDYMQAAQAAGKEAEAAIALKLTPMTVSGTPTTKAEVTDYTAATGLKHGGISSLRRGYAQGPSEFEVEEMDEEEIITPDYLMKEEGVNIGPQVFYNTGRGDRANALMIWDQMSTPDKSIFDFDFEIFFQDGGWRDMIKGEAPAVQENTMMASAPSMEDSRNDMAMQMFNKPYHELNELEIEALNEYNSGLMAKGGIAGLKNGGRPGYEMGLGPVGRGMGPEEIETESEWISPVSDTKEVDTIHRIYEERGHEGLQAYLERNPDLKYKYIIHGDAMTGELSVMPNKLHQDFLDKENIIMIGDGQGGTIDMSGWTLSENKKAKGGIAGLRKGYNIGDIVTADAEAVVSDVPQSQVDQIQGSQMTEQAYNEIYSKFIEKFPNIETGNMSIADMVAMLQLEGVMAQDLGILGLDSAMGMITPQSAEKSAQRISMGDTQWGEIPYAKGGRIRRANGGIMDMGGLEKDYRFSGGFVPIGEYEKKDDVPARLSKNEFVFTADAVRAAGGGNINKGAKRMYETMKNLEAQPTAKRMIA